MIHTDVVRYEPEPAREEIGTSTGLWGMSLLIITEAALFASLLLAYFYERSNAPAWPPPGIGKPELILPFIMTALLLGSSVTIFIAERGINRGSQVMLVIGLVLSLVLAISFLGLQAYEYMNQDFSLGDSVYSSAFYTITGIHGIHVSIAVLMGLVVILRALLGHFTAARHQALTNVALYWHFVDVVWLFILASLYLSPHLL